MNKIRGGRIGLRLVFGLVLATAALAEPRNLSVLKEEIVAYIDSGAYLQEVTAVAKTATAFVEQRAPQGGGRLAIVFDIDETILSNLPHIRSRDFGYEPAAWDAWVARGEAPVIEPVREVYRAARRLGVSVIFITGRHEKDRPGTEKNLRAAGLGDYAVLALKPAATGDTTESFKTATRKRLTAEGYVIIANLGDQESDLAGGFAERVFKLPGPFYLTR